ncbi:DUF1828 domain-containing protein [Lactiplantibacillus pentosus]|uniref:DUF1828 domain-containing protein n=1 Tax=Lactiplantibacillus pentosus TaxID=1589 RepID=UPI002079A3F9|nr:DUF1828 domain-containing protein [Lactiplantibacillus pentosus]USJ87295.1 DUF1828 domain-containing protein [Lactiplantibacillus pentosus]
MQSKSQLVTSIEAFYARHHYWTPTNEKVTRIETPFVNRHRDAVIFYVVQETKQGLKLTDGGYTLDDLEGEDCFSSQSPQQLQLLTGQLERRGVTFDSESHEIFLRTSTQDYARHQIQLLHALLFVEDLFSATATQYEGPFIDQVHDFLTSVKRHITAQPTLADSSNQTRYADFVVVSSEHGPAKLIWTMNNADNRSYAAAIIIEKCQIQSQHANTEFYVMINDEAPVAEDVIQILKAEDITPVLFSKRYEHVAQLTGQANWDEPEC